MNQKGGEKKSKHTRLLVKSILISISPYRSLLIDIYRIEKKKWDDWNRGIPFETRSWFLNEEQPRVEKSRAQKVAFQRDQSNFPSFPAAWRSVKKPVGRFKSRLDAFYIVKGPRLPAAPLPNNLSSGHRGEYSALPKSKPNDLLSRHVRPRSRMKELPLQSFPNRRLVTVLSLNISVSREWGRVDVVWSP